jgi:hypothetical protein
MIGGAPRPFNELSTKKKVAELIRIFGSYNKVLDAYPNFKRNFEQVEDPYRGNTRSALEEAFELTDDVGVPAKGMPPMGENPRGRRPAVVPDSAGGEPKTEKKKSGRKPKSDSAGGEPKRVKREPASEDEADELSFPADIFASPPQSPQLSDDGYFRDVLNALGATSPLSTAEADLDLFDVYEGNGYSGGATNEQIGQAARYRTRVREALDPPKYECLYRNLSYIVHSSDENARGNPFSPNDKYDAKAQKILETAEANLRRVEEMRDAGIEPRKVPRCSGKVFKPETTPAVAPSVFKASTRRRAPASAVDFTEGNTSVFKPSTRRRPASASAFDFTAPSKYLPPAPPMLKGRGMVYPYLL